ncbi:hypothetical protein ARALYDRAFT_315881 [Arabidopsis lyrata subsp. lyrata]|uniref:Protein PLANT CADMIUM RESISTANCE 12 n=1 Tax=Arabidopsis lyrata subsp. lyrata TaxID=81972 RepID=D7KWE5_ARALL|nr:hypothetical protein ARALYDRAFT_315881 [Arabidopsis lyrata subsp. lyrata]
MYGNGPVFKAEGTSFRDQPYAEQLPQGLWTTGLCDCHEDAHISCMNAGLIHLALGFVGCSWLYAFPSRSRLREHFALPEEPCRDFLVHLFCTPCAICQESRELKNRGADPSIGWLSNVEKWSREKVTPPIVVPGMIR